MHPAFAELLLDAAIRIKLHNLSRGVVEQAAHTVVSSPDDVSARVSAVAGRGYPAVR